MTGPRMRVQPSLGVGVPTLKVSDHAAVLDAYDAHHDELYAFLVAATRDAATAEDLLQETYFRLVREARAGRMPEQPRPWLYRVAANLVVSRARRALTRPGGRPTDGRGRRSRSAPGHVLRRSSGHRTCG